MDRCEWKLVLASLLVLFLEATTSAQKIKIIVDQDAREAPQRAAGETDRLLCRRALLRIAGDDPKDCMAFRGRGRDSRQGSDL